VILPKIGCCVNVEISQPYHDGGAFFCADTKRWLAVGY